MSTSSIQLQTPSDPSVRLNAPRSSSDSQSSTFLDIVRCSRCQRSLSINDSSTPAAGVVQFGMNSYYCSRCASMVGFNNRWTTVHNLEQNMQNGKEKKNSNTILLRSLRSLSVYRQTDLGHRMLHNDRAEKLYGKHTLGTNKARTTPWKVAYLSEHEHEGFAREFISKSISYRVVFHDDDSCDATVQDHGQIAWILDYTLSNHTLLCMIKVHLEYTRITTSSWEGVIISLWTMDQLIHLVVLLLLFLFLGLRLRYPNSARCFYWIPYVFS